VEPTAAQDWITSAIAVTVGVLGILVARSAFAAGREIVPEGGIRRTLEHKLFFDELYDAVFARPAQLLAEALRDRAETPVVEGSLDGLARGTTEVASGVASVQTGLLRTYAFVITGSVVVLGVVFLVLR
jgi:NADH-quinone oxidoreductase subunit L